MAQPTLEPFFDALRARLPLRWRGRVTHAAGTLIESEGPFCSVGECCEIESGGAVSQGEVIGFRGSTVLSMPLEKPSGIRYGDRICTWGAKPALRVGDELLGRVIDGQGNALDGEGAYAARSVRPVDGSAPLPLERVAIREPIGCGVRAVDAFITCGRGQRMGIFGGSGVGKSTLIGMMRSEEHTSELQSPVQLVCRLLLEKKKNSLIKFRQRAQHADLHHRPHSAQPHLPYHRARRPCQPDLAAPDLERKGPAI